MTSEDKKELPDGFVLLERRDGKPLHAACLDGGRFHGWLMWKHPDGQWVSQRQLEAWEIMQAEDQRDDCIVHETSSEVTHVAQYTGVEFSRYCIEWTNGPLPVGTKFYTAPVPTPATQADLPVVGDAVTDLLDASDVERDAARYRYLSENIKDGYELPGGFYLPDHDTSNWDRTIDAALQQSQQDGGGK